MQEQLDELYSNIQSARDSFVGLELPDLSWAKDLLANSMVLIEEMKHEGQ